MAGEKTSIVLFCATSRGLAVLEELAVLAPECSLTVLSFREEPCEPAFLDSIRSRAGSLGAGFLEAKKTGSPELAAFWDSRPADLMLAVNWRYMIPAGVYRRASKGTFVFHDSLLPAYRGFSPTVWAIANDERRCGATLFEIAEEYDRGPVVDQEAVVIGPDDTITDLFPRVTEAYLAILRRTLAALLAGSAGRKVQDESAATYVARRTAEDDRLDWTLGAARVYALIRAVTFPYSGAHCLLEGRKLRVWGGRRLPGAVPSSGAVPGQVVEVRPGEGSVVCAKDGLILVTEVQAEVAPRVRADLVLDRPGLILS
ncbi:MAG: methionyl-tRNA formyltransferase-like protein [Elusimicrobia bacterium]|nr:methionyl-tRNA formyltransferase-like protein [Elusimicrobiota bacterium]